MTPKAQQLPNGHFIDKDGDEQGWLGVACGRCFGSGEREDSVAGPCVCRGCGGTGEAYGKLREPMSGADMPEEAKR